MAVSRLTGLVRESVLGWLFGAGATFDAYIVGYRVANLARDLFAEGALSSAFVPTSTCYLDNENPRAGGELSNIMGTLLIVIVGVLLRPRHAVQRNVCGNVRARLPCSARQV